MACKQYNRPLPLHAKVSAIGEVTSVAFGSSSAVYAQQSLANALAEKVGNAVELIPVVISDANTSYMALNVLERGRLHR